MSYDYEKLDILLCLLYSRLFSKKIYSLDFCPFILPPCDALSAFSPVGWLDARLVPCVLCILTCSWVLRAPESWSKPYFSRFSTFFVHFKAFSVISRLKLTKNI